MCNPLNYYALEIRRACAFKYTVQRITKLHNFDFIFVYGLFRDAIFVRA
jgi:hypothetical protein